VTAIAKLARVCSPSYFPFEIYELDFKFDAFASAELVQLNVLNQVCHIERCPRSPSPLGSHAHAVLPAGDVLIVRGRDAHWMVLTGWI
jgi:hypothetical protein